MSDMEQSDVVDAPAEPEAQPEAPAAPSAADTAVEAPVSGPEVPAEPEAEQAPEPVEPTAEEPKVEEPKVEEPKIEWPTAEELQAEIDVLQKAIADSAQTKPFIPVQVLTRTPSSEAQKPEAVEEAPEAPLSLADAARVLLIYVKAHRTAGDSDLEAAVADVEAALAS